MRVVGAGKYLAMLLALAFLVACGGDGGDADAPIPGPSNLALLAGHVGGAGNIDGVGAAARFNGPRGVAIDGSGTVYVADYTNHTIRKITAAGVVSTLAGTAGSAGSADGTGAAARFYFPFGVAVDGSGTVYVADNNNHTIRQITAAGVVSTLAGTAGSSGSADGTGAAARFFAPFGVAVDGSGTVYVTDYTNHTIRQITAAGVVSTVVGVAGTVGFVPGSLPGALAYPQGVAVSGNHLLITTFNGVAVVAPLP